MKTVNLLINTGKTKFYTKYTDYTLLLIKEANINYIFNKLNSLQPSLQFTIDHFDTVGVHFLDISNDKIKVKLFCKSTHGGHYSNINTSIP